MFQIDKASSNLTQISLSLTCIACTQAHGKHFREILEMLQKLHVGRAQQSSVLESDGVSTADHSYSRKWNVGIRGSVGSALLL